MANFCKKCGNQLNPDEKFCSKCGTSTNGQRNQIQPQHGGKTKKTNGIVTAFIMVALLASGVYYYQKNYSDTSDTVTKVETNVEEATSTKTTVAVEKEKTEVEKAQEQLVARNIKGDVLATTFGHDNNRGFLSIVNNGGQYSFISYDAKNDRIGQTQFNKNLFYFTDKKPNGNDEAVIIFDMTIINDNHDADDKYGTWNGSDHLLPIYAFYKFDAAGNVIPGMLNTGSGAKPSHYHGYFYEQRNVDIINLFLTEMPRLQVNVSKNQVALP